jgi:hypothetical protein
MTFVFKCRSQRRAKSEEPRAKSEETTQSEGISRLGCILIPQRRAHTHTRAWWVHTAAQVVRYVLISHTLVWFHLLVKRYSFNTGAWYGDNHSTARGDAHNLHDIGRGSTYGIEDESIDILGVAPLCTYTGSLS